ncbi:hypothetical protein D0T53_09490 [Dysgonomonas sp. 216]|uniref:hypothetical protein n=1 Tax=Dysgonomonas sp. 216 TaxID=2302934 RepID=UPI0013D69AD4|nr:hypothetical protein [Dysgonomonas sp. 216]NDW19143.1 hypothetical protein [Dysgonomonas sp. 216]
MKKYYSIILAIILVSASTFAQKAFNVHKKDFSVLSISTSNIDSLKIGANQTILEIYQPEDKTDILLSDIDSLNFTETELILPTVEMSSASFQRATQKISCSCKVADIGDSDIIERGVCWSTNPNPTINDNKLAHAQAKKGIFILAIEDFELNTDYYIRSYSTNSSGTAYSLPQKVTTMKGNVTYTLSGEINQTDRPRVYQLIKTAMDSACYYYNRYTSFEGNVWVYYSEGIPTAQASFRGSIGFGANEWYMWVGTAMHEMAHYFGSGTTNEYRNMFVDGVFTGTTASTLLKELTGETLKGDSQHFWPYGINQRSEITNLGSAQKQKEALIIHAKIVEAMRIDCGWRRQ